MPVHPVGLMAQGISLMFGLIVAEELNEGLLVLVLKLLVFVLLVLIFEFDELLCCTGFL